MQSSLSPAHGQMQNKERKLNEFSFKEIFSQVHDHKMAVEMPSHPLQTSFKEITDKLSSLEGCYSYFK